MDTNDNLNNQECLVSTLSMLRESSKTAVVSADATDEYTMYMHVNRPVQDKFVSILESTYDSSGAVLILLCGSVGDGKSHILSYCNSMYKDMMDCFYVHNDSTASLYIDKPASYTLKKIMDDFSDEKIETSNAKVILAINLGTLSNFLEDDKENKFSKLKKYIDDSGILDEQNIDCVDSENFYSVNFADYHLYELSKQGISSRYVKGLMDKIVQKTEDNCFYQSYLKSCCNCEAADCCPIKANYEILADEKVQDGIINSFVENIVKNKLIVSTRALLNMIYEIIVDESVWERGSLEPRKQPFKMSSTSYCRALFPNTLFGKRDNTDLLDTMKTVDPTRIRNEKIDDFIVYYENTADIIEIFKKDLENYLYIIKPFVDTDFSDLSTHELKEEILKIYIRLCGLLGNRTDILPRDSNYDEYMRAVYDWNVGNTVGLKGIYGIVENGVMAWNGHVEKSEMQLQVGNKKTNYHLIQRINITPSVIKVEKKDEDILYSFKDELRLRYVYNSEKDTADLDVDFALFELLKRILNGYVPSINDKKVNVKCVEFINKISKGGSKMKQLFIRNLSQKEVSEYVIEYDETFGYTFEVR